MQDLRIGLGPLLVALLLGGCASPYQGGTYPESAVMRPAPPIEERASLPAPTRPDTRVTHPQERPAAVSSLIQRARDQRRSGAGEAALASLERALRISPRDGEIYYELARTHQALAQPAQARQLAQRGLSLSEDASTRRALQALLADL